MHLSFVRSLALVSSLLLLISCGNEQQSDSSTDEKSTLTDNGAEVTDCMSRPDYICEQGLAAAPLGTMLAFSGIEDLEAQDSVENQQGYVWLTRTLPFEDGTVVIEGQFIDERQSNDTLLSESTVNRVRINSPSFRTAENIRVGSTLQELQQAFPDSTFLVDAVPGFSVMQVRLSSSHILFLVPDQAFTPAPEQDYPTFDRLDPYTKIESIVVM
ncbi:MAG: hypothetical protein AAFV07_02545 [Bacteroidota bacterium]